MGVPGSTAKKKKQPGQRFSSPRLILQFTEVVQWFYFRENYTFQRIQRGANIFQWSPTFSRGGDPNANFYINPYNL